MAASKNTNTGTLPDQDSIVHLQAALKRYCLSLTGSSWDAEDLAQDTWLKALEPLRAGHSNPEAFLLRVAKNAWIDAGRRKAVLQRILQQSNEAKYIEQENGEFEAEMAFQAMIKHLSPLQRAVFLMRDVLDYSAAETAELLDTTEGAVKAALYRARLAIPAVRKELSADGPTLPEEQSFRAFLERMADAYKQGQIEELIEITQQGDAKPDTVIAISLRMQSVQPYSVNAAPRNLDMRMAA
ncbi:RNA polymerase sigma-70 factor, ECF subfamily [Paenibacillus sophorae]|uniref:RNA polymerase sigma factor n=1 Tax=Paenibacillus sophorae TaxID=1333845 RepID=A0A1H8U759_9BACL|nr:RNA polymerase sigma factor [Paenibacillus sophorae]QWU17976.1 RNA polymerase sigma factor [Paenibacillus sophorae]SEO98916.1 RNA polymerase sigma-70 factor, ECF subfamily [Paenibacillus sophorae]